MGDRFEQAAQELEGAGYELIEKIGSGGMGTVFKAKHIKTGNMVAIKLMRSDMSPRRTKRLWREAVAGSRLEHPNICKVLDVGTTVNNQPFLIMELLLGRSLAEALGRSHALEVRGAISYTKDILAGVAAAHEAGILHRDLKPANIFLAIENNKEIIKLVDFGVCLPQHEDVTRITKIGGMVGTIRYMSPEQLRGIRDIGPPADLFAVGVVLYRMLSGSMPYRAKSREELLKRILAHEVTPLTEHRMDIPHSVVSVVMKALHPDPRERFAQASDFVDALNECERMRSAEILVGSQVPHEDSDPNMALRRTAPATPSAKDAVPTPTFDPFDVKVGEHFRITKPVMTPAVPGLPPMKRNSNLAVSTEQLQEETAQTLETYSTGNDSEAHKPSLRLVTPLAEGGIRTSSSVSFEEVPTPAVPTPSPTPMDSLSNLPTTSAPISKLAYEDSVQSSEDIIHTPPVEKTKKRGWMAPLFATACLLALLGGGVMYGPQILGALDVESSAGDVFGDPQPPATVTEVLEPTTTDHEKTLPAHKVFELPENKGTQILETNTQAKVPSHGAQDDASPSNGDSMDGAFKTLSNDAAEDEVVEASKEKGKDLAGDVYVKENKALVDVIKKEPKASKKLRPVVTKRSVQPKRKKQIEKTRKARESKEGPKEKDDDIIEESPY